MSRAALVLLFALVGLVLVAEARLPRRPNAGETPPTADAIRQKIADAKAQQAARGKGTGAKHAPAANPVNAHAAAPRQGPRHAPPKHK